LRAGLATDMVLLEGTVPKVITDYKRQERWQRGDWQDLPWLFKKIPGIEGGCMFEEKNVVAAHNRWKIFDKIRRTVRPQCMVALLALGLLVPGIPAVLWAGMVVFLLIFTRLPLTLNLRFWLRSLPKIVFFAFYDLCMLPYIAYQNMRALKIIFAEGLIFNPHLKWISAAQSMRFTDTNELKAAVWWARKVFIAMGILAAAVAWLNPPALAVTAGLCIVWAIAPLLIFRLSGPEFPAWLTMYSRLWYFFWMIAPGWSEKKLSAPAGVKGLDQEQAEYLRVVAQDTWNWFAEYVTEEENWLPPDNTAHRASGIEVAHYTSPTNIGLYLVSVVSAWDLGFISREEAVNRVRQTLNIVERLEKWNGHILNYYNTQTLLATRRYISLVDSGNFAACLLVIARAFPQEDVGELAQRLFDKMSFTPLYDFNRGLFYTGYDQEVKHATSAYDESRCPMTEIEEETAKMFNISYYDMLISEARIASFVSVAKGDVDDYHWFNLERQFLRGRAGTIAASWGGTAFEYLMPPLFLKERELSPFWLGRNNERAVKAQIRYGRKSGMACWGASECGFVDRDPQAPYSYHAWGTPGIGIKYARKEEQPRPIVAPYAAIMGIEYAPAETFGNLKRFEQAGARGRTGFFESLNLEIGGVTQEHMSHHHGMSLIALNNFLNSGAVRERFHSHPLVRNAELLLKEYAPSSERFDPASIRTKNLFSVTDTPGVNMLGNAEYAVLIDSFGNSASKIGLCRCLVNDLYVRRWRGDIRRPSGQYFYLRDRDTGSVWSIAFEPSRAPPVMYEAEHAAYFTRFMNIHEDIRAVGKVFVPPTGMLEVWQVTVTNETARDRKLSLTSYLEWALHNSRLDRDHPVFNRLFVHTEHKEYAPDLHAIVAFHRKSGMFGFHSVNSEINSFETSRRQFIGVEHDQDMPFGISGKLSNTTGYTLDPAASLRVDIDLQPYESKTFLFLTGAGNSEDEVRQLARDHSSWSKISRLLRMSALSMEKKAYNRGLSSEDARNLAAIVSLLCYPQPEYLGSARARMENTQGQQGLWQYGVSGDFPLLLFKIKSRAGLDHVLTLSRIHSLMTESSFMAEFVVLNCCDDPSEKAQIETCLERIKEPGLFAFDPERMPDQDQALFESWADLVLDTDLTALKDCARQRRDGGRTFGHFSDDGKEFIITDILTPRPWSHILSNPEYGALVTCHGPAYAWFINSQQNRTTPYVPDAVVDQWPRALFIKDASTGSVFSPFFHPLKTEGTYTVRYGMGYAVFTHERESIFIEATVFVPADEPVEVWLVRIRNNTAIDKKFSITVYNELALADHSDKTRFRIMAEYDAESDGLLFRNPAATVPQAVAFGTVSGRMHSFDTDRRSFIGGNRALCNSQALEADRLACSTGIDLEAIAAMRSDVLIAAGHEESVVFVLGQAQGKDDACRIMQKYKDPVYAREALEKTRAWWLALLGEFIVSTQDRTFDAMVNYWLRYQAIAAHLFARTGYYQSGGAIGFRDQLQTSLVGLYTDPALTRRQIILHAAHQFEEGDVQHWWHPQTNLGSRTTISDNLLWLAYALSIYVRATGDEQILDVTVPYLSGPLLEANSCGCMFVPRISEKKDTVYAHALRAIEYALARFGAHGLPLMGSGDRNDGMSGIGPMGKGESVWLAFFLY
ncbi:MAG: glucoamylase family protein, partial [Candidatus Omnitrophica bacterium]|nr:glucoamylase family protein [Candidatus Omnitrophota bacterium]